MEMHNYRLEIKVELNGAVKRPRTVLINLMLKRLVPLGYSYTDNDDLEHNGIITVSKNFAPETSESVIFREIETAFSIEKKVSNVELLRFTEFVPHVDAAKEIGEMFGRYYKSAKDVNYVSSN